MMPRVASALVALLAAALAPAPAWSEPAATYAPLTRPLDIQQVPDKPIYYSIGNPGVPDSANEGNTSNAGYVITDSGVVVFDALGTPSLGFALLSDIRKHTDKPILFVVASHYHADHIYGLQAFKDHSSAEIIAQERASEYKENEATADERASQRLDQRRGALYPWVDKDTRVVPPDITFAQRASLSLGGKRFSLLSAGPAHSGSDIMMMVQPDGVLFAGDIVQNGRIPFMNGDDVDTGQWLKALDEVLALEPTFIIPGHGKPSAAAKEAIAFTHDYIAYVREAMGKAVENWTDFDTAYAATDWSRYRSFPAFDNNNRGNAYRIYIEMEGAQFRK